MTSLYLDQAAPSRKTERLAQYVPRSINTHPAEVADQLTVGGRLVHRLTHRCVSTCNIVAALAGLGPVEVR